MGNTIFFDHTCEKCGHEYNETAVLQLFTPGKLGGHVLCTDCIQDIRAKDYCNKSKAQQKCEKCFRHSTNETIVAKVYWFGKYHNRYVCLPCLHIQLNRTLD